ncbi:PREDICTED: BTB/POZ domain-containing protein At4g08455-like [Prunus mume]|uniref:BTB/POZ domain-containing protein At4g08455-like n=1 Tax=Prunus mume TaxID=102107 RepID=A0ABM0N573_PRUMU|nr:PREDICTED: BTB/POZ domain-containing protein At4g08455-like [Prunus mume]
MLDCKPVDTPIVQNHHLGEYPDQVSTNKERYQSATRTSRPRSLFSPPPASFLLRHGSVHASVPVTAPKAILKSCSTVFSAMFENMMEESLSGTIKTVDVSYGTLRAFVNYLYTAEVVCLDQQLACDLLEMADKYQVQHLKDLCQKFLESNLNWDNSLSTYTFVHQHNAKQIINLALTLITDNMDKLTNREEYAELKEKDLRLVFEIYGAWKTICFLRCGIICFQTSNNISFLPYKLPTKASSQVLHFCK